MPDSASPKQEQVYELITQTLFGLTDQESEEAADALAAVESDEIIDFVLLAVGDCALSNTGLTTRNRAARLLAKFGSRARNYTEKVSAMLNDKEASVAATAAYALWRIEGNVKRSMPTLLCMLRSSDPMAKQFACWALAQMGTEAMPALPLLIEGLNEADSETRLYAVRALANLSIDAFRKGFPLELAKQAFLPLLSVNDPEVRLGAIHVLKDVPPSFTGVELLAEGLHDADSRVRRLCVLILGLWGEAARQATGPLLNALRDPEIDVRGMAAVLLSAWNVSANEILPVLTEAAEQGSAEVQSMIRDALKGLRPAR